MNKPSVPSSRTVSGGFANGGSLLHQASGQTDRGGESHAAGQVGNPSSPQSDALRRLYTIAEIAEALQLSDSTIRRAIRLKHLAAIKVGRIVRLTAADVEAWVNRLRRKTR